MRLPIPLILSNVLFLDVPDFHSGSSDTPVWSADGKLVFYTAQVGSSVELLQVTLDGQSERLTTSPDGTLHYHPQPSPDGKWLLYGSNHNPENGSAVQKVQAGLLGFNRSQTGFTCSALGPLGPRPSTKETFCPSCRSSYCTPSRFDEWK